MKFYTNRSGNSDPVGQVYLCGGGSMIADVASALTAATSAEVSLAKPVIAVPAFCDRRFYGALGAALYPTHETA